jgi:hypothetical protein
MRTFVSCARLRDVYVGWATPPLMGNAAFGSKKDMQLLILHVPTGTKALYEAATGWKDFEIIIEYTPDGILPVDTAVSISFDSGLLIVRTSRVEWIEVYSSNGSLLYQAPKAPGDAIFPISHLPKGVLLVRGGNGWVKKIFIP